MMMEVVDGGRREKRGVFMKRKRERKREGDSCGGWGSRVGHGCFGVCVFV